MTEEHGADRWPADVDGLRRAAVLGSPIAHSLSPALHRAAYAQLGLPGWRYDAVDVVEADLAGFLAGCGPEWAGLSLTMPLKRAVLPLLDDVDEVVRATGVVNTVTWEPAGDGGVGRRALGANTDVEGLVRALRPAVEEAGRTSDLRGAVLGGGATAVSAVAALAALGCSSVVAHVRSPARAAALVDVGARCGAQVELAPWDAAASGLAGADVVIATAPAGAADEVAAGLAPGRTGGVLLDVVYDPSPTALGAAWAAGGPVVDGFEMLVHQAVGQVRLMTGRAPAADVLREAGLAERRRRARDDA
ncbi:shikimate dehydrogenase [uncultured Pseudokineococcus sp.]|uniref:shikimate dehydrogenase n=1 Tax=uncultured Pseudokineococcus sp. TaxID=1642928 RepID=UPI00262E2B06|nr:shikimate dehydrogenase [uncultured Pseudokineococcus sp.]